MNILILGSGGREHSLAWAIKQNPKCDRLIVAPGNAGTAQIAQNADLNILDGDAIATFATDNAIDLVVIGPEGPLAVGVADTLRAAGLSVFGPSEAAAQLESSKTFTKTICDAAGAPTAAWAKFDNLTEAKSYVTAQGAPIVIKADGLAAGKGVTVAETIDQAHAALNDMFDGAFGAAGTSVVIEECMFGEEASFFVLSDGTSILPIGTAQDHKRAFDGDTGPNTGGMGAYAPAPCLTPAIQKQVLDEIVQPTIAEMAKRGTPFQGVLYVGLMIEDTGRARLIEYNTRFGDPETQVLMMRLGGQILDILQACAEGRLSEVTANWADDHAITIVMAANGYPGDYQKGSVISGLDALPADSHHMIFHAGTAETDGKFTASGGRVLNITARGTTLAEAHKRAYDMASQIDWPDGFMRTDIGWRAL